MTTHHTPTSMRNPPGLRWRQAIGTWISRARERHALAGLSDRELRDIGVTPGEAYAESIKPFWSP